ncbi:hypothetical protein KFL_001000350 [Klebsormidium nitens]|uniref:GMP phosphodiesterase delta subunit domain-containing protein n=1 Tax=Klebsormidium nitens TaxID=105231 RepID=A0A1Y1HVC1_KLENI|nr:hypothetical protein KFL_001000350 [Klebsormidium nitens]|eukprot:GAQ82113.1 hypothetical protein KFL_001000350 [Klebsormidium nitens]
MAATKVAAAKVVPLNCVAPEQVLALKEPTKGFLCPLSANIYGIDFTEFEVKDCDSGEVVFSIRKDPTGPAMPSAPLDLDPELEAQFRTIQYTFPASFLRFKTVRTALTFRVGPEPLSNFRMIERHYFKNKLTRSYDFNFGFVIPNSTNSWESIYDMPKLTEAQVREMVDCPYESRSDSFYFVNDELVMHNKAEYAFEL